MYKTVQLILVWNNFSKNELVALKLHQNNYIKNDLSNVQSADSEEDI